MPDIRRGSSQPPTRVMRNGVEITRIMRGTVEHWVNYREEIVHYTVVGGHNIELPSWCREIDFIVLGGGGGGDRGNSGNGAAGDGGQAGQWHVGSAIVPYPSLVLEVGYGGSGTTGSNYDSTDGRATSIWGPNNEVIAQGQGGARGSGTAGEPQAGSPGNQSYAGLSISGGSGGAMNEDGGSPGGGGGGGGGGLFGAFSVGRPGGRGEAIIRYRSGPMQ